MPKTVRHRRREAKPRFGGDMCFYCGAAGSFENWCDGCGQHVCDACNGPVPVWGKHSVERHKQEWRKI